MHKYSKNVLVGLTALSIVSVQSGAASAGGFAIREQSTTALGAAFAGNAASDNLSAIFWNPAAVSNVRIGISTETHAAVILPDVSINPDGTLGAFNGNTVDIGKDAVVPASYAAYRVNDKVTIGYGFNSPFGLSTQPDDQNYAGAFDSRKAALKTLNFNPVVAYQLTPTLNVGVGLQVMFSELKLKQAAQIAGFPTSNLRGEDWSFGFTAGLLWKPVEGTSVGIGYRSRMKQDLEGFLNVDGIPAATQAIKAEGFDLPDVLTISLRQDITPNMRLLGTFEWTNWSILQTVNITNRDTGAAVSTFAPKWDDGYYFALGAEYDYSDQITLRSGVGYEISPIQDPSQRLLSIPDTDRIWLSLGATYKWNETTSIDLAYTHIFGQDERISSVSGFAGEVDAAVDIIGVSFRSNWGADGPFGVLKAFN